MLNKERSLDLKQRISELEESVQTFQELVMHSYDALAIMDGEGRLIFLNPAVERLLGIDNASILGKRVKDLIKDGLISADGSVNIATIRKPHTFIMTTVAGKQALCTGVPVLNRDGTLRKIYFNLRDITELNELNNKFQQSQRLVSKYLLELNEVKGLQTARAKFVARDPAMRRIVETAARLGRVDATVLILGESGVGKELVARLIHESSPRAQLGGFVKINCGAIPAELLESELFGYEPGAFTGASKDGKPGYFEIADRGTFFLDEIGELPLKLQVKLLSAIQDQEITRLGATKATKIDVRIVAATNRNLEDSVRKGEFREDLFYRLNVVPLYIPALRARKEDIPFMLLHFLSMYNKKYDRSITFSKEAVDRLCSYSWPGNVRELSNLVEHLVVLTEDSSIRTEHLPAKFTSLGSNPIEIPDKIRSLRHEVDRYEQALIQKALSASSAPVDAARSLGISLSTLHRRLRKSILTKRQE